MKSIISNYILMTLVLAGMVAGNYGCGKATEVANETIVEAVIEHAVGDDADVDIDAEGGSVSMTSKDGDNTITMEAGESVPFPADFPSDIPVPVGATWQMVQTSTEEGSSLMLQGLVSTPLAEVSATLRAQITEQGWESVQDISQAGEMEMMTFSKGDYTLSYTLTKDGERTSVMVIRG